MLNLYSINGKKYLVILLICQLLFFLTLLLTIFLFVIKFDGIIDISSLIISLPLWVLYGISALWIGLFWKAFSETIFSIQMSTKVLFQQRFIVPILIVCLLGAYTTHAMLITEPINNRLIVTFTPFFLACTVAIFATIYITVIAFESIRNDEKVKVISQKKHAELKKDFGAEATRRIELAVDLAYGKPIANPLPHQQGFTMVGLTSKPWYEMKDLPSAKLLEDSYEIIKEEILQAIDSTTLLKPYDYPGVNTVGWDYTSLIENYKKVESSSLHFPKTVKVLEELSKYARLTTVELSVLKPGEVAKPHRDTGNTRIICQLALVIPEKCGISVGGESRSWKEGKCVFFDPSYEHTVWNYSDTPRAVLIVVLLKPELTNIEMDFITYTDVS